MCERYWYPRNSRYAEYLSSSNGFVNYIVIIGHPWVGFRLGRLAASIGVDNTFTDSRLVGLEGLAKRWTMVDVMGVNL